MTTGGAVMATAVCPSVQTASIRVEIHAPNAENQSTK
jgi:hypothetical protein